MTATAESRPRPLRWLYGLIAITLASIGVAAGNVFFYGPLSLIVPEVKATARCEALHRGSSDALRACTAEQVRLRGSVVAVAVLVLLAGAVAVAVAVPWRDLRRLRRLGRLDAPMAQDRFAELCRRHGLSGRQTPRLWVAGPAVRHAFTTGLPGRRPTIVVPARLALDPGDRFDAVVTHEIAHVLARDVTWVSAVRGPAWLFVPALALASMPAFGRIGGSPELIAAQVGIALLAAAVVLLAAALLRLREHEADRYAAGAGMEPALVALFSRATPARPSGPVAWARRALARHPEAADRSLALRHTARAYEGGLVQAAAVGFVTVAAMNTVVALTLFWNPRLSSWGGGVLPTLTGVAVLALLFPSLVRRAHVHLARPQWWRAVVGVGVGVGLGSLLVHAIAVTSPRYPLVWPGSPARAALAVAVFALAVAGVVALAVGAAELMARAEQPRLARLAAGATALAAVAALWPVGLVSALLHDSDDLRYFLTYGLARFAWPALALGLLLVYALSLRRAPRRLLPWLVALAAATVAGAAAILVQPATSQLTDQLRAQQQRWWICAAAGVVVLVVVALATPLPHGWAWAVLAATATTGAATAVHYGYGWLTDRPTEPDLFAADVAVAPVWLGYATMLLAALLVPLAGRCDGVAPLARWRAVAPTVAAAVLVGVVALALVVVGVPGGVAMNAAQRQLAAFDKRYEAARRVLTPRQAERVAQSATLVLPLTWSVPESGPPGQGIVSPGVAVSDPACEPLVRERFLAVGEPHLRATGKRTYTSDSGDGGLKYTDLTVTVYAYDAAVGEAVLTAARDARRACSSFTLGEPPGSLDFQVRAGTPPPAGELAWRYDSTMSTTVAGVPFSGANAYVMLAVGYTVVTVHLSAQQEPLDEELLRRVLATTERTVLYPG
ncbi:Peptidase family M48 [Micromonospora phaseoli]|uniref:Peptidase family M48 n=1 Tax=Micromonospora phaseoli TaxID=1144548 RepID=A0A1H6V2K9_9ACTN|nr:M48 family metalloprotease [Micromonospora phaseoli]PZV93738.1 peptidase M48-like protein [Micromonospora phaseoli]GIJ79219.1 hypothetical protein Xph01_36510 [Micromonospora phaseoli]SEI98788.1 Peptidase family M48 [Micromonospora phaseoli]